MLYVLHEPIAAEGDLPVVRRLLLTSANLSAAPWGYTRGEQPGMGPSPRARHRPRGHPPLQKPTCLREAARWGREGERALAPWVQRRGRGGALPKLADSSGVPLSL